jgi:hypothetical protein
MAFLAVEWPHSYLTQVTQAQYYLTSMWGLRCYIAECTLRLTTCLYRHAHNTTLGVSPFSAVSQPEAVQGLCRDVPTVAGVSGALQARVGRLQKVSGCKGWEGPLC